MYKSAWVWLCRDRGGYRKVDVQHVARQIPSKFCVLPHWAFHQECVSVCACVSLMWFWILLTFYLDLKNSFHINPTFLYVVLEHFPYPRCL